MQKEKVISFVLILSMIRISLNNLKITVLEEPIDDSTSTVEQIH